MKSIPLYIMTLFISILPGNGRDIDENWLQNTKEEKAELIHKNEKVRSNIINAIYGYEEYVNDSRLSNEYRMHFLFKIRKLETELSNIDDQFDLNFSQFRYKKGIEILKMIHEKILSLDHHFTTLSTFHEIQELSNPHSYPEFIKIKENIKESTKQKTSVEMPALLDVNPLVTLGFSLVSSIFGDNNKAERTRDLEEISCLLDFTVNMHSDLKIIMYETSYLTVANNDLKEECLQLFKDYTKVIGYNSTLTECRDLDDWDKVYEQLDTLILTLEGNIGATTDLERKQFIQKLNNLEFSIDRLLNFVDSYDDFVRQGEHYYQKFQTILQSYQNKEVCISELPKDYHTLDLKIQTSIDKFKNTYNIAELQGSKLRDLLYGTPQ